MAQKRRFLDVWIVESNTVYREVPYLVVVDWVQQGRLLEDDMLRPSGTAKWYRLGVTPALAAYLPRSEPFRAEDQAEALEPVQLDFRWKRGGGDEDDDPDMVPLIDISLVLLIFFMMAISVTVGAAAAGSAPEAIDVPEAAHGAIIGSPDALRIGISRGQDGTVIYSLAEGEQVPAAKNRNLSYDAFKERFQERMARVSPREPVEVRLTGDRRLPFHVIRQVTVDLDEYRQQRKIKAVRAEVSEKKP